MQHVSTCRTYRSDTAGETELLVVVRILHSVVVHPR